MATEISHIDVSSAFRVALVLGGVNGFLVSLPIIWHWLDTMKWITGVEMGPGMFTVGVLISVATTAITTAVVVVIFVVVYNLVARTYGGVELSLSK